MDVEYDYISLVALGNFNPAIVSPDFLKRDCGFEFGELTDQSPPNIPVAKKLIYENVLITVDLTGLTVKETKVKENLETDVLNIFNNIYSTLPYTPLDAVGVNIKSKLIFKDGEELNKIEKKVANPGSYIDFLKVHQLQVNESYLYMEEDETWISSHFVIEDINGLTRRIDPNRKDEFIFLNYNNEAGNLREGKTGRSSRLKILFDGYREFKEEFLRFLKYLERNR